MPHQTFSSEQVVPQHADIAPMEAKFSESGLERIDLVCTDMDGTVLGGDHKIHAASFQMMKEAQQLGCPVIPATGRCRLSAAKAFALGGIDLYSKPGVYLNGCVVYDHSGAVVSSVTLDFGVVEELVARFRNNSDLVLLVCAGDRVLSPYTDDFVNQLAIRFDDPWPENCGGYDGLLRKVRDEVSANMVHVISKCIPFPSELAAELRHFASQNGSSAAQSLVNLVDILPQGVNKGHGIRVLKESMGFRGIACIGDAENDLEMLQCCDFPVAMGNAIPKAKALARLVVNRNDHATAPGVADLLQRIVNAKRFQ